MSEMIQTEELTTDDLRILAYVQHMSQTAQPAAATRLFKLFAQQETRRIERTKAMRQMPIGAGSIDNERNNQ